MKPDWLGNMPSSWSSVPFGSVFTQSKRKNSMLQRDFVLSVIKDRGVIPYTEKGNVGNKVSDDLSGYKLVDKGDFVLNSMNLYMGSVGVSDYDGVTSTAYIVCKPSENVYAGYYNYLIQFKGFQEYVGLLGKGIMEIREAVRWTALKSVFVPLPDLETQRQIADFLDRETARIDLLIEKKQRLVALLETHLEEALHAAVLGGASVEREAGANWLKDLPNGWKLTPLKHFVSVLGGATPSKDRDDYWNGDIPWVSPKDMKVDLIQTVTDHVSEAAIRGSALSLIPKGAVLIVVRGMILARYVPVCQLGCIGTINQDMKALIPDPKYVSSEYLQLMLKGFSPVLTSFVEEAAHGTKKLRSDQLFNMKFPLPSKEIQTGITGRLKKQQEQSLSIREKTLTSIDGLKEYRAALITAAVTGQIDVASHSRSGATERTLDTLQEEMNA